MTEDRKQEELSPAERRHVEHSEGWLMLGNPVEAERELLQIDPKKRLSHPKVCSALWGLYDKAGWTEKRDALFPRYQKPLRILLLRLAWSLICLPFALGAAMWRKVWKAFRGPSLKR